MQSLSVHTATGLMPGVRQVLSPHFNARPEPADLSLIVVHGISLPAGEFGGPWIDRLFTGSLPAGAHPEFEAVAALRVSAHLVIRRDGTLTQYVPFGARAWHAGRSSYQGRADCNDYSVGIELEGADDVTYSNLQYALLAASIRALCAAYPMLDGSRVVGHSDIAPGRKTDPGPAFDWTRLRTALER